MPALLIRKRSASTAKEWGTSRRDVLDEVDLTTLDEQTIAALYHGMEDDPLQDEEDDEDFQDGQ